MPERMTFESRYKNLLQTDTLTEDQQSYLETAREINQFVSNCISLDDISNNIKSLQKVRTTGTLLYAKLICEEFLEDPNNTNQEKEIFNALNKDMHSLVLDGLSISAKNIYLEISNNIDRVLKIDTNEYSDRSKIRSLYFSFYSMLLIAQFKIEDLSWWARGILYFLGGTEKIQGLLSDIKQKVAELDSYNLTTPQQESDQKQIAELSCSYFSFLFSSAKDVPCSEEEQMDSLSYLF